MYEEIGTIDPTDSYIFKHSQDERLTQSHHDIEKWVRITKLRIKDSIHRVKLKIKQSKKPLHQFFLPHPHYIHLKSKTKTTRAKAKSRTNIHTLSTYSILKTKPHNKYKNSRIRQFFPDIPKIPLLAKDTHNDLKPP